MEAPFRRDTRILIYSQFSSLLGSFFFFFLFKPTLLSEIRSSQRKWMDGSSTWRWRDNERHYLVNYSFKGRGGGAYPSVRWFVWIWLLTMDQPAQLTPNTAPTLWLHTPQQQRGCVFHFLVQPELHARLRRGGISIYHSWRAPVQGADGPGRVSILSPLSRPSPTHSQTH